MDEKVQITRILKRKKNSNCLLFLNNEYFMDFSLDLIMKYQLKKIIQEQRIINVKQAAYNFACYKQRTRKQVITKLKEKNFESSEISIAIDFLDEFKLLNDEKYAQLFAKEYINRKKCGEKKVYMELLKRGIEKQLAEKTINDIFPQDDKFDLALTNAKKKINMIKSKPLEKQKQLLISHLQRNGFDWDIIKKVLSSAFTENQI
jgi:regulatory protein